MPKYLIIDTETSGLDKHKHELLSLGAMVLIDGVVTESIEIKVEPRKISNADPEALKVNGYSEYRWKNALPAKQAGFIIQQLFLRHTDAILVGHNVQFDIGFLYEFGKSVNTKFQLPTPYIDTRDICRVALAPFGCQSMSLDNICLFLGWKRRKAHTALSDCEDCVRIIQNLCPPKASFIFRLHTMQLIRTVKGILS